MSSCADWGKFLARVYHKTSSQVGEDVKTNIQALRKCFSYSRHEVICLVVAKEHTSIKLIVIFSDPDYAFINPNLKKKVFI